MTRIADRYFDTDDMTTARIWPLPAFRALERQRRDGHGDLPRSHQSGRSRHDGASQFLFARLVQCDPDQEREDVLVSAHLRLPGLGLHLYRARWSRIRRPIDLDHPMAPLAHQSLCRPLARQSHALPHVARSAMLRTIRISVSRRTSIASSTAARSATASIPSPSFSISKLTSLVSFAIILWDLSANFTLPYTTIAVPGFLFWVALLYAGLGTMHHPSDRPPARQSLLRRGSAMRRISASRSRGCANMASRSRSCAARRRRRSRSASGFRPYRQELFRHHRMPQAAARLHELVCAVQPGHSLYRLGAVLFRRQDRARHHDADGQCLRQGQ